MPMALLGMLASLAVWEVVRYCRDHWGLTTRAPGIAQALLHCAQIGEFDVPAQHGNTGMISFFFLPSEATIGILALATSNR
jgi:hypothetical protein